MNPHTASNVLCYEVRIDDNAQSVPAGEVVLVHEHRQGLYNRVEVWIKVANGELRTDAEVFTIPIGEAYPMKDTIIVTTQVDMAGHQVTSEEAKS